MSSRLGGGLCGGDTVVVLRSKEIPDCESVDSLSLSILMSYELGGSLPLFFSKSSANLFFQFLSMGISMMESNP